MLSCLVWTVDTHAHDRHLKDGTLYGVVAIGDDEPS